MDGKVSAPVNSELSNAYSPEWGSDAVALALVDLRIPYMAITPGASYRGLHDSLVNFLGEDAPRLLLCAHEQNAVALAHGYAKVTDQPMLVGLHANVGLMNAVMAIYNAYCDRVPMVIVGATGPVDGPSRRPWIDWIHTSQDQGGLIRNFVKWDAQVVSASAAVEAIHRANIIARTPPYGPTYVCLDVAMQESEIDEQPKSLDPARYRPARPPRPAVEDIESAAVLLQGATAPLILIGRVSRDAEAWSKRVALAERTGAQVLTDFKQSSAFPTDHPCHAGPPIFHPTPVAGALIRNADVILSLDWVDLGGLLSYAGNEGEVTAKVIDVSPDQYVHNGWSFDHQALAPADIRILTRADEAVDALLQRMGIEDNEPARASEVDGTGVDANSDRGVELDCRDIAAALAAQREKELSIIRLPIGWPLDAWSVKGPLDYLGVDGGGGVGSGPGMAVGAALALSKAGRIPVAVLGDGDTFMTNNALWTAAHHEIPLLLIVANNRSYFNDELHQDRVAERRGRNRENRGVGIRIEDPDIDFSKLAEAQGWKSYGVIRDREHLQRAVADGLSLVQEGQRCLLDVRVKRQYAN